MSPFAKIEYESGFTLVLCLDAGVQFIANGRTRIRRSEASLTELVFATAEDLATGHAQRR